MTQQVAAVRQQLALSTHGNRMVVLAMFSMWSHYREGLLARKVEYTDQFRACDLMYRRFIEHGVLPVSIMPLYNLVMEMYSAGLHMPT